MLRDFTWTEKYEEAMSDEHLLKYLSHAMLKQCNGIIKGWLHCLMSESKGRFLANNILLA